MQIYDKNRPYVNRQTLIDIKQLALSPTLDTTKKMVENIYKSKFLCPMLCRGRRGSFEQFSPYLLTNDDEEYVLPIFTNELEINRCKEDFDEYTVYLCNFADILGIYTALATKLSIFIAIDPYGTNFILTQDMIEIIKEIGLQTKR